MRSLDRFLLRRILLVSFLLPQILRAEVDYRTRIRFASVESAVRACDALPTVDERTRCHRGNVNEYNRVRSSFWEQFWHMLHPVYREMIGEACIDGPITAGPVLERSYQCISRQIRSGRLRFSGTSDAVRLWDNFLRGHSGVVRSLGACRAHVSGGSDAGHRTCGTEAALRLIDTIPEPLSPMDATSVGAALVPSVERPGPGGASATSGSGGSASGAAEISAEAGSRFVDPEDADGATAGHCEAAIPDTSRRSAILRSLVMGSCSDRPAGSRPESELNLFDPMVALSSQNYVDGLRRYTIQELLTRYTESFGNDLSRRFDRSGGACRVRRVPEGCSRNSEIMAEFNRVGCAEVDSTRIASDRRARRSDEYQRVTRAQATEIRDLMRRGREVTAAISFAEGAEPRPPADDSPGSAARDLSYLELRARYLDTVTRLPQLREELDSIRNRVAAIQAAAPHLRLTRSELSDHAGDEWFIPSIVNAVAAETNLTRIRESTERGYRELEEQMWGAVANACDPEQLTHEDLVLNPSIVNRFLAISPNRELYGDLQRCMAGQMDSANRTRSGLQLVTVAACGVIGFGLAGPAGVALGAGCGLASAGVSYAEYGVASRRMELIAQCRASVRSEEDALCTQAEYLEARQRFDEAVSALTVDAASTVAFDFLLPGVGAALGRLRPDRIAEIASEINRARALPTAEAEAELARIAQTLRTEGEEGLSILARADGGPASTDGSLGASFSGGPAIPPSSSGASHVLEGSLPSGATAPPSHAARLATEATRDLSAPTEELMGARQMRVGRLNYRRLSPDTLRAAERDTAAYLERLGIFHNRTSDIPACAVSSFTDAGMVSPHDGLTGLYELSSSTTRRITPGSTLALEHPEFDDLLREMQSMGPPRGRILVDPSLPFHGGAGAFFRPVDNVIVIPPGASIDTLVHEVEHARIDHRVMRYLGGGDPRSGEATLRGLASRAGTLPRFEFPSDMDPRVVEAVRMAERGIGVTGIHETLAVRAQRDALARLGYGPIDTLEHNLYSLEHSESELVAMMRALPSERVTDAQHATLAEIRRERLLITGLVNEREIARRNRNLVRTVAATAVVGGVVGTGLGVVGFQVFHNSETDTYIVTHPDGRVQSIGPAQLREMIPDESLRLYGATADRAAEVPAGTSTAAPPVVSAPARTRP